jgi:hypothetical protein
VEEVYIMKKKKTFTLSSETIAFIEDIKNKTLLSSTAIVEESIKKFKLSLEEKKYDLRK